MYVTRKQARTSPYRDTGNNQVGSSPLTIRLYWPLLRESHEMIHKRVMSKKCFQNVNILQMTYCLRKFYFSICLLPIWIFSVLLTPNHKTLKICHAFSPSLTPTLQHRTGFPWKLARHARSRSCRTYNGKNKML